jgi:hypothetical protein
MDQQVAKIFACIAAESQDRLDVRSLRNRISGASDRAMKIQRGADLE